MLLNDLPIEIILQVFSYLGSQETITVFSNLNSYFNSIIRCINNGYLQVSYEDAQTVRLVQQYPRQIGRLTIIHSPNLDFTSLINLRSLTIKFGTIIQLNAIRPQYFPLLEILHICGVNSSSVDEKSKAINDLFEIILSDGFLQLRICTAAGIEVLQPNEKWTGSSTIRLLILDGQPPTVNEFIGGLCPNLCQPKSIVNIPIDSRMNITLLETHPRPGNRRLLRDIMQIPRLEAERRFILEDCTITETNNLFKTVICGRILPKSEPYCFASFLFEIKIPSDYPFKPPDGRFLQPIYHPSIREDGEHYCCYWGFKDDWSPRIALVDYINRVIDLIDNPDSDLDLSEEHSDIIRYNEYKKNYESFREKAVRSVFLYGQPRF